MIIVIHIYWQVELTVQNTGEVANPNNTRNIILKNCTPFTDCISEANNTQIDNAKEIDIVMPMYYLILMYIVIIIPKHQEFYGNTMKVNHF